MAYVYLVQEILGGSPSNNQPSTIGAFTRKKDAHYFVDRLAGTRSELTKRHWLVRFRTNRLDYGTPIPWEFH